MLFILGTIKHFMKHGPWTIPAVRISFALTLISVSILLVGDLLGVVPDRSVAMLDARKTISESVAVQITELASKNDIPKIRRILKFLVVRNNDLIAAGLRSDSGGLLAESGDHGRLWGDYRSIKSTSSHVVVPIFRQNRAWGSLELRFKDLHTDSLERFIEDSLTQLIVFFSVCGFIGFLFLVRRTLRELDPSSVIPERVNAAFNTLAEGVLILDEHEHIVLANTAFSEKLSRSPASLIGVKASELNWRPDSNEPDKQGFPWLETMRDGQARIDVSLNLDTPSKKSRTLMVNSTPIYDAQEQLRGVMATFGDITELEQTNEELHYMVKELEHSQKEVERQNTELHFLATRDPLTDCLNRRSFNTQFENLFTEAEDEDTDLLCIMADIDHFKAVNDNHGHAVGDKVIKLLADILHENTNDYDLVGRYGGEEFCVVFPKSSADEVIQIAERMRSQIKSDSAEAFVSGLRVTASFGVSSIRDGAKTADDLNNEADRALYIAKESGRNRVVRWDPLQSELSVKSDLLAVESAESELVDSNKEGIAELKDRIDQLEQVASKYSEELNYLDSHDPVTGLPNQVLFYDRVYQAIKVAKRSGNHMAVLTLEVDLFKKFNYALGRLAGDTLMHMVATRFSAKLRDHDGISFFESNQNDPTFSRLDTNEFGILLTELNTKEAVIWIVKRIFDALSFPFDMDDKEIYLSTNIGISIYPDDGTTPENLVSNASVARYYSKKLPGENNFQFFDEPMNTISMHQMQIEVDLRRAIDKEEFCLHYQPKIDLESRKIIGVEALVRWNHPHKGLLLPHHFIKIAEQRGLIVDLGRWVLREACRQAKQWVDQGMEEVSIAVNLSTVQLRQTDLAEEILKILEDEGLAPKHLELEITESVVMENLDNVVLILQQLSHSGIRLSMDDFGTGYSSLNCLKHLPLNTIKIDRSFLQDITSDSHDRTIVSTIIAMAHNLKLCVVAEGVETEGQLAVLQQFDCDQIQGYLFSRPVASDQATALLQADQNQLLDRSA